MHDHQFDFQTLNLNLSPQRATVTFDNGEINILDEPAVRELSQLIDILEKRRDIRVVVFQSANDGFFLSHASFPLLQHFRDEGAYDRPGMPLYSGMLERLRTLPQVTICKVEGRARGGGAEWVLACDMAFGAIGRASLAQMEIAMGILPGGGGALYLAQKVGRARAMEICLGGGDFDAEDAARYGYINRALPADAIGPFVEELAVRIASYASDAITMNKAAVDLVGNPPHEAFIRNNELFAHLVRQDDFNRRVDAFEAQGGNRRQGEWDDWRTWAHRLADG